jgi:hypothetical protein
MIEGLKITVPGSEVAALLTKKAEYHRTRAAEYRKTFETLVAVMGGITKEDAPKMSTSQQDPRENAKSGMERHEKHARENDFMSKYVNTEEMFLLATEDLHRLGVLESRF